MFVCFGAMGFMFATLAVSLWWLRVWVGLDCLCLLYLIGYSDIAFAALCLMVVVVFLLR